MMARAAVAAQSSLSNGVAIRSSTKPNSQRPFLRHTCSVEDSGIGVGNHRGCGRRPQATGRRVLNFGKLAVSNGGNGFEIRLGSALAVVVCVGYEIRHYIEHRAEVEHRPFVDRSRGLHGGCYVRDF